MTNEAIKAKLKVVKPTDISTDDLIFDELADNQAFAYPRIRQDLIVSPTDGETVLVRRPESDRAFPLYKLEWQIAEFLDGATSLEDIAQKMTKKGFLVNPALIKSFIRELKGYGFLQSEGTSSQQSKAAPVKVPEAQADKLSAEERQFFDMAMSLHSRGDLEAACNYLMAMLEINPANHNIRSLLREFSQELAYKPQKAVPTPLPQVPETPKEKTSNTIVLEVPKQKNYLIPLYIAVFLLGGAIIAVSVKVILRPENGPIARENTQANAITTPIPTPQPTQAPGQLIQLIIQPLNTSIIKAPANGGILKFMVQEGSVVETNSLLATIITEKEHKRLKALEREAERFERLAKTNKALADFALDAGRRLDKLQRQLRPIKIEAPAAGVIKKISVDDTEKIAKNQAIFELADTSEMIATISKSNLAIKVNEHQCKIKVITKDGSPIACKLLEANNGDIVVKLDNRAQILASGQLLEIEIRPVDAK